MIPKHKEREHEALNSQVEEFLNGGGRIEKLDSGLLSTDYAATQHTAAVVSNAIKSKAKAEARRREQEPEFKKLERMLELYGTKGKLAKALGLATHQVTNYIKRANYIGKRPLGKIQALYNELTRLGKL